MRKRNVEDTAHVAVDLADAYGFPQGVLHLQVPAIDDLPRPPHVEHRRSRPRGVSRQIAPHAVTYAVIAADHPFGSLLDDVDPALQEGDFECL